LNLNLDDIEKIKILSDWLNKYDCVLGVEIPLIIDTHPIHIDLFTNFTTKNGSKYVGLCIFMSDPPNLGRFHY